VVEISEKVQRRLAQLFALMGSDNAHEREAARVKLDGTLRKHRKNWNDLMEILKTGSYDSVGDADDDDDQNETREQANQDFCALELVQYALQQYVDLKPHEYIAVALWVLHTHVFNQFLISPRLGIVSPVRECGKTTLLALVEVLSAQAQRTDGITAAAIYRMIDQMRPTLLVDEADNLGLATDGPLRAVLNSGHRKGGAITRVIKDRPKRFSTFCPMAIAAIGSLPLPIMARSIVIHMERTDGARPLRRLKERDIDDANSDVNIIYRQVFHWAKNVNLDLDPEIPREFRNRQADNWRPLFAIADSFGPTWGAAAREAAFALKRGYHDEDIGVMMLSDIRTIFDELATDRISSEQLVESLNNMEGAIWSEWRGMHDDQQPRQLSQGQLAQILRPFQIRSRSIWPRHRHGKSRKGYLRGQFETAWTSYCSQHHTTSCRRRQTSVRALR
jgi:hypothetical protein